MKGDQKIQGRLTSISWIKRKARTCVQGEDAYIKANTFKETTGYSTET